VNILFVTKVGSHVWRMDTEKSDTDLFQVYVTPTKDILRGKANTKSKFIHGHDADLAVHEVGTVIEQLLKGNLNFIIGVMSPLIVETSKEHQELREIVSRNLAKNCYHSIRGMAIHNYKKYIETGRDVSENRCNKIIRVLRFGTTLLEDGEIVFEPSSTGTPNAILGWLNALDGAYNSSSLPEKPNEEEYREWLLKVRLKYLGGDKCG